jgi:hypothetical protein
MKSLETSNGHDTSRSDPANEIVSLETGSIDSSTNPDDGCTFMDRELTVRAVSISPVCGRTRSLRSDSTRKTMP